MVAMNVPGSPHAGHPIEPMRMMAVVLLVLYHVIGADAQAGLQLEGMHPARIFADFFADLRMPLFAFIAGHVYAQVPVDPRQLHGFLLGKARRLALPGIVAVSVFMLAAAVLQIRFAPEGDWWRNYLWPYAHLWFLQAILVIFLVVGSIDIVTRGRLLMPMLAASVAWFLLGGYLSNEIMSVNQAAYLAPFFLTGVVVVRHPEAIVSARTAILAIALAVVAAGSWINLAALSETGMLSQDRRDLRALGVGTAGVMLCYLLLPHTRSRVFGSLAFTIYLYHVLATSAMRRALHAVGIQDLSVHLVAGLVAGIGIPVGLHLFAMRHPLSQLLIVGQRSKRQRHIIAQTA